MGSYLPCRFLEMALEAEFSANRAQDPFVRQGYLQAARSFRTLAGSYSRARTHPQRPA